MSMFILKPCDPSRPAMLREESKTILRRQRVLAGLALLGLAVVTSVLFWRTLHQGFIGYDDPEYITEDPYIKGPVSWPALVWALKTGYFCSWHPITWISYMLDYQVYGLNPGGYHLTNLLLHVGNSMLVFVLFRQMTGSIWRSALLAAIFAWHPLRVESVAWVSERKDVLSTFFFLLTLIAYSKWITAKGAGRRPAAGCGNRASTFYPASWFLLSLALFCLALMSKPMVVTLPCVLLLLDYWPLQRFEISQLRSQVRYLGKLVVEKVPFFILAFVVSIVTVVVQKSGGAVSSLAGTPLHLRLENTFVAYARYMTKFLWPADLSVFYPYPARWPVGTICVSVALLAVCSILAILMAERRKFLAVGWLWFVGTLVPAIGLVQVGSQSMADRYTYIPCLGLAIIVAWSMGEWASRSVRAAATSTCLATMGLAVLLFGACAQLGFWNDGVTLFGHALKVTDGNYVAYNYLGKAYGDEGRIDEAINLCSESVRLAPWYSEGHYNLGTLLIGRGRADEAIDHLQKAITYEPGSARAYNNLGKALAMQGKMSESIEALRKAVLLKPEWADAHYNLGTQLLRSSRSDEAAAEFLESLHLGPNNSAYHANLGVALAQTGRATEALCHFFEAVRLGPDNAQARFNLGLTLLDQGRAEEAASQFAEEARLTPGDPKAHYRLALALARLGVTPRAVEQYRETLRLAPDFTQAANELAALERAEKD